MSAYMASINISVKKEAYEFLNNLKTEDKSFSDVILSFKKENKDITKFFGILKDIDWETKEKQMKDLRRSFNERLR
jgi:predicted CopG family antitoxin